MTTPISTPKRKNPLAKTRQPLLPPSARSRTAHGLTLAAAEGRFVLQRCEECSKYTYPPRDACPHCLSHLLPFVDAPRGGTMICETIIRVSSDSYFREHLPWRQGIVQSDCGPQIIAHIHGDCVEGQAVRLSLQLDKSGQAVMFALPAQETPDMRDDPQLREMTADPRHRRVLITDGRSPVGQALVKSLVKAGVAKIFVGIADPWKPLPSEAYFNEIEVVECVALDPTDEQSVFDLASDIGAKVDILINTVDHTRQSPLFDRGSAGKLSDAVDTMLLGSMRLAQAFGPVMASRGADGAHSATAWVNVLSAYALANAPAYGAVSVAHAACLSLSHWLRAELRPGGVRLLNAFAGPIDTEWYQTMPPPKVAPSQLADAIVDGLQRGLEEIYVGDVAKDIRERLAANPKALEREIGQ